ncbi:PssE/Cps14G family polysaccharide biosynthesis glycosyltransferase [Amedibacillus dolichus]|uniref:Glycosyltransferase family 28 C-terminal domain protein n=1 Tax=Amedibacillus dolichus DSM 3991 TaxID=428127 RepID=A8RE92_9FIRM|nr:PssE/Cps14G family polysaccharide biosynthesis glycosyltransferase [Amedibacillus dolichus]EDP10482.1 glycosyltransferase family 28 C-terminal domain protein [Amedibacillus dolichus DSM 3991]
MIFITLGSQKFQFNRVLIKIDELVEKGLLKEQVFAQIGYSDYKPKFYEYKDFLDREDFFKKMELSNIVITHGGTGAIIGALKKEKKVIAIPRLAKYGEHVDDHQIQIINEFESLNLIEPVYNIDKLSDAINSILTRKYATYKSNTTNIINDIKKFLEEIR